ncbi:zf-CCHC domain-containing protein [Cucumis melo var. makuwa]|uniref:Zf-CCHC domain-containing protein n=1 Tax=Cucumis melo var. makuwa TaxID=1194695 RepID=A0A5D3DVI8_CUCMM|nr:zf-CCHC domain-containing protein [Cucumis melo var. makuwa]TYK27766.1 zf-CCHC domain-containing protein [Cucumis melo var. makuwa]
MMAARLKNINRKNMWEINLSKKQSYTNNANKQPSTSIAEKGKDVEAPETTKKKENAIKGRAQNNYNRPSLALADEEYNSASDGNKTMEEETEFIEVDDGERISFVIQRVLIVPKEETNPQHHCLFKTRCTINGKVYDVIIDSTSSENFIAKRLVAALNLKAETHPNLYKMDVCHLLLGRP